MVCVLVIMANNNGNGSSGSNSDVSIDDQHKFSNARSYQIEALNQAIKQNTIVFLETGSGKTLIAIMLLRRYAHLLKKPSPNIAVFLVPTVVLVKQQAEVARQHLDLKVLMVMTPAILKDALKHSFLSLSTIKLLIFDECHNARGKHDYVQIMTEYDHQKRGGASQLPRILGMTASPMKAKGSSSNKEYWKQIKELESVMHSKKGMNQKNPEFKSESSTESAIRRLSRLNSAFEFCLQELGFGLASKATEADSSEANDFFTWGKQDARGETVAREFCKDANGIFSSYIPAWMGGYGHLIATQKLTLCVNPKLFGWRQNYTAGNNSPVQSQSRGVQNKIIDEFRKGKVNIIVATSILEEGLDVQSCNLVIRFDLFILSLQLYTVLEVVLDCARNSEFLLLLHSAYDYVEEQVQYVPPELLGQCRSDSSKLYHLYLIKLLFDLDADRGNIVVSITYIGASLLSSEQ
ncbi:endoribonuclease Dicer homolog 2, partial [Tanacetum coccineum]